MIFYIYHILGKKIGCTKALDKRMRDQGFINWEILEEHTDGWLAGDREIELQKEYGYPVDKVHYMISLQNRRVWQKEDMIKGGNTRASQFTSKHQANAARSANTKQRTCPHCGKEGKGHGTMNMWHFDNCKQKKAI
jgi:hypothetical protein